MENNVFIHINLVIYFEIIKMQFYVINIQDVQNIDDILLVKNYKYIFLKIKN